MLPKHKLDFSVFSGQADLPELSQNFEGFLFNQSHYWQLQVLSPSPKLAVLLKKTPRGQKQLKASLQLFRQGDTFVSPWLAPFGHIELSPDIQFEELVFFLKNLQEYLAEQGGERLQLKAYPDAYAPNLAPMLTQALLNEGFQILESNLNQHLPVRSEIAFKDLLHHSEKRRLHKAQKAGLKASIWQNPDLAEAYRFIAAARKRKGYPMSMSWQAFEQMFRHLPEYYRVHTVRQTNTIAALTVSVRVNSQILYNFYPADNPDYLHYSPTVSLNAHLYDFAQKEGFKLLDLGISTEAGKPNFGLIRFKRNLGAKNSLKLSFEKVL